MKHLDKIITSFVTIISTHRSMCNSALREHSKFSKNDSILNANQTRSSHRDYKAQMEASHRIKSSPLNKEHLTSALTCILYLGWKFLEINKNLHLQLELPTSSMLDEKFMLIFWNLQSPPPPACSLSSLLITCKFLEINKNFPSNFQEGGSSSWRCKLLI